MAGDERQESDRLIDRLVERFYEYDFFAAVRKLQRNAEGFARVGRSKLPEQETVRFRQEPHVRFSPSNLSGVEETADGRVALSQDAFGLFGPNGGLPLAFTEYAFQRARFSQKTAGGEGAGRSDTRITTAEFRDLARFVRRLKLRDSVFVEHVVGFFSTQLRQDLKDYPVRELIRYPKLGQLMEELNKLLDQPNLWNPDACGILELPAQVVEDAERGQKGESLRQFNRTLLDAGFPKTLTSFRQRNSQDRAISDFVNLFHNRFAAYFYRAWAINRKVVDFENSYDEEFGDERRFPAYLGAFVGVGMAQLRNCDAVSDLSRFYYAGQVSSLPRHASGLSAILQDYFGFPVQVDQYQGGWFPIPESDRSGLGTVSNSGTLGGDAVIGDRFWDSQMTYRLRLGPMRLEQYLGMLPAPCGREFLGTFLSGNLAACADFVIGEWFREFETELDRLPSELRKGAPDGRQQRWAIANGLCYRFTRQFDRGDLPADLVTAVRDNLGQSVATRLGRQFEQYRNHQRLRSWNRFYSGDEFITQAQLVLDRAEQPETCLGESGRLGWTTWLVSEEAVLMRDLKDPVTLARRLLDKNDRVAKHVAKRLSAGCRRNLKSIKADTDDATPLLEGLNEMLNGELLYHETVFAGVTLRPEVTQQLRDPRCEQSARRRRLNRMLLEDVFPAELRREGEVDDLILAEI